MTRVTMELSAEEAALIYSLRENISKEHSRRSAYISNRWSFLPDRLIPGAYRRVRTSVALYACTYCHAPAGVYCKSERGSVFTPHASRGDGKKQKDEQRQQTALALISAGLFDHIELCKVVAVLKGDVVDDQQ